LNGHHYQDSREQRRLRTRQNSTLKSSTQTLFISQTASALKPDGDHSSLKLSAPARSFTDIRTVEVSRTERLQFAKHFERAQGWLLLDKFAEAIGALDAIPTTFQNRTEVLMLRAHAHQSARQWPQAETIFRLLLAVDDTEPHHWIGLAYAVRRSQSIEKAEPILEDAHRRFPDVALISYNLACYAAQLDRLKEADRLLREAIRLDAMFHELAQTDSDLVAFWERLKSGNFRERNNE
jgi:tetratricopeptide (TPR) repeat protein